MQFAAFAILAACTHRGDGIELTAPLTTPPDWTCIRDAVRATGPIEVTRDDTNKTARALSVHGLSPPGTVQTLVYRSDGIDYALQIDVETKSSVTYRHYSIFPPDKASTDELEASRARIRQTSHAIEERCAVRDLLQSGSFQCHGKNCPSIPRIP
jgi:hypothetical protein